jgi:hypothetical protein
MLYGFGASAKGLVSNCNIIVGGRIPGIDRQCSIEKLNRLIIASFLLGHVS